MRMSLIEEASVRCENAADRFELLFARSRQGKFGLVDAEELKFLEVEIQLIQAEALTALARRQ